LVGYARCSTDKQDLAAQRQTLRGLGVSDDRVYLDHGMSGRNRKRPGLEQALAAVRGGDTLVIPKLDRLARSVPDARAIGDTLTAGGVRLSIGGTVYDPSDPMGKMFFNILATFAEFEVDLLRMRTREGMAIARASGKLKGKQPKLSPRQRVHVLQLVQAGDTIAELAELFAVSRATIYREIARARPPQNVR
jgi:DNA invertase Pin-like site-specific DNA recombinase